MAKKPAPKEIKHWFEKGEFGGDEKTFKDVIDSASNLLDGSNASEIVGPGVLFRTTDGKFYTVQVEARIVPVSKKEAVDMLEYDPDETNSQDDVSGREVLEHVGIIKKPKKR